MPLFSRPAQFVLELAAWTTFSVHLVSQLCLLYRSCLHELEETTFSPNHYLVIFYLFFNAALNVFWLDRLSSNEDSFNEAWHDESWQQWTDSKAPEKKDLEQLEASCHVRPLAISTYPLFYVFSNLLLASSSLAAFHGFLDFSHLLLVVNFLANLCFIYGLTGNPLNSTITPENFLTHLVMKTNIGFGTLLVCKAWSMPDEMSNPTIGDLVNAGLIFLFMTIASGPDPTLGLCLLFILLSFIVGNASAYTVDAASSAWQLAFILTSVVVVACLLIEFKLSQRRNFPWLEGWNTPRESPTSWYHDASDFDSVF